MKKSLKIAFLLFVLFIPFFVKAQSTFEKIEGQKKNSK